MTAAETIAAAIEKLVALRDDAALLPYAVENDEGLLVLRAHDGYDIAIDFDRENAELLSTLSRTIDAQLAILHAAQIEHTDIMTSIEEPYWDAAVVLARAILGEAS